MEKWFNPWLMTKDETDAQILDAHEIAELWHSEIQEDIESFAQRIEDKHRNQLHDQHELGGVQRRHSDDKKTTINKGALLHQLAGLLETELPTIDTNKNIEVLKKGQTNVKLNMEAQKKWAKIQKFVTQRAKEKQQAEQEKENEEPERRTSVPANDRGRVHSGESMKRLRERHLSLRRKGKKSMIIFEDVL